MMNYKVYRVKEMKLKNQKMIVFEDNKIIKINQNIYQINYKV